VSFPHPSSLHVELQEFIWREYTRADIPEVFQLLQTINRADDDDYYETVEDLDKQFEDARCNPATDARIIRTRAGELAAWLRVIVHPTPQNENVAFIVRDIAPEFRGGGLEELALEWLEQRAQARIMQVAEISSVRQLPCLIRTQFIHHETANLHLYRSHGYSHVRSAYNMQCDLHEPIPASPLPETLALREYAQDIDEKLREAFNEAFRDHWAHEDIPADAWQQFIVGASDMRKDLSLAVMDGAEVAALSINFDNTLQNERLGIRRGWVGILATRRPWRKRGIASALLAETMRRFKAEGFDSVGLGVDAKNLTGALALYERIGFKTYKTRLVLEKHVASSA
jgi:GNAT superfamily N-acetyltransferase